MKKTIALLMAVSFLCLTGDAWANARQTRAQYRKNLTYNKNALPAGWNYEASYTLWRLQKGLEANRHTYRRYKNDRNWHSNMQRNHRPQQIVLNGLDWTAEEVALFWRNYNEYFQIPPAGTEVIRR